MTITRRRIAATLFLLIAGSGLAAQDRITDAQWIGLLWLSWIPFLVAVWLVIPTTALSMLARLPLGIRMQLRTCDDD